jgi:hypothetical protein
LKQRLAQLVHHDEDARVNFTDALFCHLWVTNARAFQVTRIKVECCRDERFVKARRVNPRKFFAELNPYVR